MSALTARWTRLQQAHGQVLPLFALFLVVLLGMAALAIDVGGALSARRFYRSAADAAALAGAQDLQAGTTRAVTAAEQLRARTNAMARLVSLLGATSTPTCPPASDIVDCAMPGTGYRVSIKTPSPSCVTCSPDRSLQVTVRNPAYGLTFARVLGQSTWDVASTSVAGLTYRKAYTIQTLRPPKKTGSTFDVKDITLEGNGTTVNVVTGDVGTNANMNYSGLGALLRLDPGYEMWFFDPSGIPTWAPTPVGRRLTQLMADPNYRYPAMASSSGTPAPTFSDARTSEANKPGLPVTTAFVDAACRTEWGKVDPVRYSSIATTPLTDVYCYEPGIYNPAVSRGSEDPQISIGTGKVGLLKPGAYYLKGGLNVGGSVLGGYAPGVPGVALMFDECNNKCTFTGNNAFIIAINAGTRFPPTFAGGVRASPAIDWSGQPVVTSGPESPNPPILLSVLVRKDASCYVPTAPPFQEPAACDANENTTVTVAGGGGLVLEGVQYMPTDNAVITGSSTSNGRVGQIVAWTLKYSGGTQINQEGAAQQGPGVLRLDAACTTPTTVCNSP